MSPLTNFRSVVLSTAAIAFSAYVNPSVAAPPVKVDGIYELSFSFNQELTLDAHITDTDPEPNPALNGVVVFEYCSLKGLPRNDITQPDETSSSACADGSGRWIRLRGRFPVSNGHALMNFGLVQVVNVIGFRYTYSRGTEIADGSSGPVDWIR